MKKSMFATFMLIIACSLFAGYATSNAVTPTSSSSFDTSKDISVVSREDGSGTRGAFIELLGIEVKNPGGGKKDMTTKEAIIANQTSVMMTNVAGNKYAVGYISLGSLNDTVKAVQIEGVKPTAENVKSGAYPIARPFNIATKGAPAGLAKDFTDFILSADGQAIVAKNYIAVSENAPAYVAGKTSGKIVVAGSSSVTPVMEKIKEAYLRINPKAIIEIQESDSSAGMTAVMNGTCDIGMASRELKDTELKQLLPTQIAIDGIAVVVNNNNPVANFSKEQVKSIYTGKTLVWREVSK